MGKKKVKKKNGRPTRYRVAYVELVYKLCLLNATDVQIADVFEITEKTLNNWKHAHPKFFQSMKDGKIHADANVAASLYHRACGYKHDEEKIFCTDGQVTIVPTTKHYPPDTAAAFIWLKNRAGWKDKRELTGEDGGPLMLNCTVTKTYKSAEEKEDADS